jgi:hypothetical protein
MRIGVFHGRKYYLRNVSTTLSALAERGHELLLTLPESKGRPVRPPRALQDDPRVKTALYPNVRDDGLQRSVAVMRAVRNAVRYESPRLREAYANRRRAYRKLLASLSAPAAAEPLSLELSAGDNGTLEAALAELEGLVPPSGPLVRFIREQRLDAVVCIGRVNFGGGESDVAKAARAAGVPSALIVYSWDNLSSKGLVHVHPDRVFVWNDFQVDEAVELHGLPRERVIASGAPRFDEFFSLSPSAPRDELLGRLGLDPRARTVVYLGSSGFVTKREPEVVERWIQALRSSGDRELRDANILVRPHPGTLGEPAAAGPVRPPFPGRRGRRAEHERRAGGGDRRPTCPDDRDRRPRPRTGGLVALPVPSRRGRWLRPDIAQPRRARRAVAAGAVRRPTRRSAPSLRRAFRPSARAESTRRRRARRRDRGAGRRRPVDRLGLPDGRRRPLRCAR